MIGGNRLTPLGFAGLAGVWELGLRSTCPSN